jgi:hypothetical protein
MANQLIPPPGLEPPAPDKLTPGQCIRLWADSMDVAHQLLLSTLRREVGPGGDLRQAYRRWYAEEMEEHDRMIRQMAQNFYRRGMRHGR